MSSYTPEQRAHLRLVKEEALRASRQLHLSMIKDLVDEVLADINDHTPVCNIKLIDKMVEDHHRVSMIVS